jgi:hypothetical protein
LHNTIMPYLILSASFKKKKKVNEESIEM